MDAELKSFSDTLLFVEGINKFNDNIDVTKFDAVNEFVSSFMEVYKLEESKLPYHVNILDLIWANENAHSRIFAKLLQQNNGNEFDVLESFLKYLNRIKPDFKQSAKKPEITSESDRIDLLILDKEYALIIENKIHDAIDQGGQLARYIDRVKHKGYKEEEIYVIYLTRDDSKTPEDQSWQNNGHDYKQSFVERYFSISFKTNILPWLKNYALPNCKVKDVYLKSTIEQYIDYLEGMFNQRKIHKKMNSELQNHIKEVLQLNSTPEQNHPTLKNKLDELEKATNQVRNLLRFIEKECWDEWLRRLKDEFQGYTIVDHSDVDRYKKVGIVMEFNGMKFDALIEYDNTTIYYGLARHENNTPNELNKNLKPILKPCLEGLKESPNWYGWKSTSFKNGYMRLKNLIEDVQNQLATNNKTSLTSNN